MLILKVVVSDYWFDEIKSGRKKHEYRKFSEYWINRLTIDLSIDVLAPLAQPFVRFGNIVYHIRLKPYELIEFQRAYRKNPERMTFKIKKIGCLNTGIDTDLKCEDPVFDIKLDKRVK